MATKKNKDSKAWMIPEGETRDSASYHFVAHKTTSMIREGKKIRVKKYHPGLRKHVWFIETKMPSHNKQ
jgi:large subunit ribosomal protein L33